MRTAALAEWASERGYRVAWGPWRAAAEAFAELTERRRSGELDPSFARTYLGFLEEAGRDSAGPPAWVILVLLPAPAHTVTFTRHGRPRRVAIPPTYTRYRATAEAVVADLSTALFGGVGLRPLTAPLKALSARLGLTRYGRNNVTYAEGFGSFHRIVGCATSEDLSEGACEPGPPLPLEECSRCDACERLCPTGAIVADRFLLRAEKCLVFFNERPEDIPQWVPRGSHRCLIGCLACQAACPANAGKLKVEDTGLVFSEEETAVILDSAAPEGAPALRAAAEKIAALGLTEATAILWRNLGLLAAARGWPGDAGS